MKRKPKLRLYVQIFFFALIGLIAVNHTLAEAGMGIPLLADSSLHALCPFGGVVTLYNLGTLGTFIQMIHMSSVILMVLVFILAILFGPVFCGWICPLGSFQEWIGKLGKKLLGKRYGKVIPTQVDRVLKYARYGVLVWVVYVTARSGYLMFAEIDPYNALFSFWSDEVAIPGLIILLITMAASLVVTRPWCRYACPYGALLGLSNKVRIFSIQRNETTCINCRQCDNNCPMGIVVSNQAKVTDLHCISCLECTSEQACPIPDTVNLMNGIFITQPKAGGEAKA